MPQKTLNIFLKLGNFWIHIQNSKFKSFEKKIFIVFARLFKILAHWSIFLLLSLIVDKKDSVQHLADMIKENKECRKCSLLGTEKCNTSISACICKDGFFGENCTRK